MNTIVYYYSLTGHCESLAGKIAAGLHCASERIIEKKQRLSRGFLRFLNGGSAVQKKVGEIEALANDPGQFERIVVVTPFWAASPTPAVRGFFIRYQDDLKGKKLGLVLSNLGTDPAEVIPKYQELSPEPLVTTSFTKAKGEWDDPKESAGIEAYISLLRNN